MLFCMLLEYSIAVFVCSLPIKQLATITLFFNNGMLMIDTFPCY